MINVMRMTSIATDTLDIRENHQIGGNLPSDLGALTQLSESLSLNQKSFCSPDRDTGCILDNIIQSIVVGIH